MAKKKAEPAINKVHDTDLWKEIRTLYESPLKHNYEKIKKILTAEFDLDSFPSKSTVERHAKKEQWQRAVSDGDIKLFNDTFTTEFWLTVKSIYEANTKLSYKRLKEYVQNELQCEDFPSQAAISAKAKAEGWKTANSLVSKDDAELKKMRLNIKNATSTFDQMVKVIIKDKKNNSENQDDDDDDHYNDDEPIIDYELYDQAVNNEKSAIKNLLMDSQIKKKNLIDTILKSRKRMSTLNDSADYLADRLMLNQALLLSRDFRQTCGEHVVEMIQNETKILARIAGTFNELSFNRRESIKFELSLYGVTIEDLQNAGKENERVKAIDDNTAFDEQRARLEKERQRLLERRKWIESGGLEAEVQAEVQRRMTEADGTDEAEDAEFDEIAE